MKEKNLWQHISYRWYWLSALTIVVILIFSVVLVAPAFTELAQAPTISLDNHNPVIIATHYGLPQRLEISSIQLDAEIESVGLTNDGAMDVPKNPDNVAWYNLGPRPGEQGSAVIDGHLDGPYQTPAVFENLAKIVVGDSVIIKDDQGKDIRFEVIEMRMYNVNDETSEIFNRQDGNYLNLITCAGTWDSGKQDYSQRRVVFTKLVK